MLEPITVSLSLRQGVVSLNANAEDYSHKLMLALQEHDGLIANEHTAAPELITTRGDAFRDVIVGELIRCEQLAAPKDAEGKVKYDAPSQVEYYAGLPPVRLRMEFDRRPVPQAEQPTTTGAVVQDGTDLYADLGVPPATS